MPGDTLPTAGVYVWWLGSAAVHCPFCLEMAGQIMEVTAGGVLRIAATGETVSWRPHSGCTCELTPSGGMTEADLAQELVQPVSTLGTPLASRL